MWSVAFRIILATVLGGIIGLERGHHGRAAGLRTHILVCLGAAIATMIGLYSSLVLHFNSDPLRVGAQVVSGIGFLGVGTIMIKKQTQVTGLTTAAGLWATACIGLAVGIGFYWVALLAFAVVMISVTLFTRIEGIRKKDDHHICYIEFINADAVKQFYLRIRPYITSIDVIPAKSGIPAHIGLEIQTKDKKKFDQIFTFAQEDHDILIALPSDPI